MEPGEETPWEKITMLAGDVSQKIDGSDAMELLDIQGSNRL